MKFFLGLLLAYTCSGQVWAANSAPVVAINCVDGTQTVNPAKHVRDQLAILKVGNEFGGAVLDGDVLSSAFQQAQSFFRGGWQNLDTAPMLSTLVNTNTYASDIFIIFNTAGNKGCIIKKGEFGKPQPG